MMASSAENPGVNGAAAPAQLFVINLAASTSPMALSHPTSPQLKRFTFFVSRQREEGRERFRLHMGYFQTQEEAENLLASVRDIYPAAWAGPAPTTGMGRRGRIAPGSVVAASPRPVPVVAAVRGLALGGGCELAMMADFIIASENAKFGQPEIKLGVAPGMGGSQRLTRAVGKAKSMEMCLTGRMMNADEAERSGLVARVVPHAELLDEALKTATTIASMPPMARSLCSNS